MRSPSSTQGIERAVHEAMDYSAAQLQKSRASFSEVVPVSHMGTCRIIIGAYVAHTSAEANSSTKSLL